LGKPQLRTALSLLELGLMVTLLLVLGDMGSKGAAIALSVTSIVSAATAFVCVHVAFRRVEASLDSRPAPGQVEVGR
jgi:Na+-driven multidrug efflux pump